MQMGMAAMEIDGGYTLYVGECAHCGEGGHAVEDALTSDLLWLDEWILKMGGSSRVVAVVLPTHAKTMERLISSKIPHAEFFTLSKSSFDITQGYQMLQKMQNVLDQRSRHQHDKCTYHGAVHALGVIAEAEFGLVVSRNAIKVIKDIENCLYMNIIHTDCLNMLNIFSQSCTRGNGSIPSLFERMSRFCITKRGKRVLRSNLMQPPRDPDVIIKRQECVEEMMEDQDGMLAVRSGLAGLSDTANSADGLLKIMSMDPDKGTSSQKIAMLTSGLIELKTFCDALVILNNALRSFHSGMFESFRGVLNRQVSGAVTETLESLFDENIVESVMMDSKKNPFITKTQQIFALKSGCQLLDAHRNRFTVATEHVHELASMLRNTYPAECATLTVKYSWSRGFFFLMKSRTHGPPSPSWMVDGEGQPEQPLQLPEGSGLVCLSDNGKTIQATCEELNALNMRIHDSSIECLKITEEILRDQCGSVVSNHLEWIVSLQDVIGEIDLLSAMAVFCSQKDGYTRPIVTKNGPLIIQQGRHPILEDILDDYVSNDTYLAEECSVQILSGPNMAGKSTFLKQNGMLAILAQIGSFVPASFMCLTPFKSISMIKENVFKGHGSLFNQKMIQVTRSIRSASDESLILIDELCDSSSSSDSIALSWAIIETMVCSGSKALITTHVDSLANLSLLYPTCCSLRIHIFDTDEQRQENRKIYPGRIQESEHYGIALAESLGFPADIIEDAGEIAEKVVGNISKGLCVQSMPGLAQERKILKACSKIDCIRELYQNKAINEDQVYESLCRVKSTITFGS